MSIKTSQNQRKPEKFKLLPTAQGFMYEGQKYSVKIMGEYKLTPKQYYAIYHLYNAPEYTMYGKDLKHSIEDSLGIPLDNHPQKQTLLKANQSSGRRPLSSGEKSDLDRALDRISLLAESELEDDETLSAIMEEIRGSASTKNPNTHYKKKTTIIRNEKVVITLPGSISSYFIKSKKTAIANLFGSLIRSTGQTGSYYLSF